MFECPERMISMSEKKTKGTLEYLRRYREAKKNLIQRADTLKGKDEPRRRKLLKSAEKMTGKAMSTEQMRRAVLNAELDLFLDADRHKGDRHGKK